MKKINAIKLLKLLDAMIKTKKISATTEISLAIDEEGNGFSPLFFEGIELEENEKGKTVITFYPLEVTQ